MGAELGHESSLMMEEGRTNLTVRAVAQRTQEACRAPFCFWCSREGGAGIPPCFSPWGGTPLAASECKELHKRIRLRHGPGVSGQGFQVRGTSTFFTPESLGGDITSKCGPLDTLQSG